MEILEFVNPQGKIIELTTVQAETLPKDKDGNILSSGEVYRRHVAIDPSVAAKVGAEMVKLASSQAIALMDANGIDPNAITGTGKDGAITVPDVRAYLDANPVK